ncbi:hypothetical protein COCSUDRAFT_59961 [Coccomyxa subellipsoidea C-169]|uniref:Uncharacterized protein n=1 Tax=Coccomyxa subellipsoidea (strain C-169) TaxID=574566 RepID=I0YJT3_COCSC|nr:hypothetical protein COCSUDRAFT_59961 [Coccomyxa subellipsoidea C-169]EIE18652.1 hypothetical protein COCSUDRAFT_59961 [Coccomyxa subellipsoidea C-169]|eukprot:XP_005643196.1 hypothetical protein COCSUDRAFT_59961 [Coccomyxa subellipsoidea C-169]
MLYRYIQLSGGQLTEGWRSTGYYYYSDKSPKYYLCFPPEADSDQESEDNGERPSDCLPEDQVPDYPGKRPLTNPPKRMRNLTQMARELPCKKLCTAKNGVTENADASMHDALGEQAAAEQAAAAAEDGNEIAAMDPGAAGEREMQEQLGSGVPMGDEEDDLVETFDMTMQQPEQQKMPEMDMQGADEKGEEAGDSGLVYGCGLASMLEDEVNSTSLDNLPLAARVAALRQNTGKPEQLLLCGSQGASKAEVTDLIAELFGSDDEAARTERGGSPQETGAATRHVPPCDAMCRPDRQLSGQSMETNNIGNEAAVTQKTAMPEEPLRTEKSPTCGILKQRRTSDETSGEAGMHAARGQLEGAKTAHKGKPLQAKEAQTHIRKRKAAAEPSKGAQMRAEMHVAQGQPVAAMACHGKPLQTEKTPSDGTQLKTADGTNREAERQAARRAEKAQLNARMHKTAEGGGGEEEMHAGRGQHAVAKTADKGKAGHDRDDSRSKGDSGISAVVQQIADEAAAMELHAAAGMDTCNSEKLPRKFFGAQGGSKARLALAGECSRKEAPVSKGLASVAAIDRKKAPSNKCLAPAAAIDKEKAPSSTGLASSAAIDSQKFPGNKSLASAAAVDRKKAPVYKGLAPAAESARKEAPNKKGRASAAGNSREAATGREGLSDEVIDYIRELQANNHHLRAEKAQLLRKCDAIKQILERWNGHFAELAALLSPGASSAW